MHSVIMKDVTKRYGAVTAVGKLSLVLEEGECFSMLGPSGCGKTTALRMIAGFEDLDEGEIYVGDTLISSRARNFYVPPEKRNFGMVFQAFAVWPHMTVAENVAFPLRQRKLTKADIAAKTLQALRETGLDTVADSYPSLLSGGQKQRIALARSISFSPRVMLLDEPLSNLDPLMREEMRFEIRELQRKVGFTIVYVTHDQAEAMALSDRVMVMGMGGTVQQVDAPIAVYTRPANRFVYEFIGLSNFLPVVIRDGAVHLAVRPMNDPICAPPAGDFPAAFTLACRPNEIAFAAEGLPGLVRRRVTLGDVIDYRVDVHGIEVRVQKNVRLAGHREGNTVRLKISRPTWFSSQGTRLG